MRVASQYFICLLPGGYRTSSKLHCCYCFVISSCHHSAWANSKQLERLVVVLLNGGYDHVGQQPPRCLSVYTILSLMLHDAQFWELLNIRGELHPRPE